jgi:N-acetylmuramoyl-L-alanine amidase
MKILLDPGHGLCRDSKKKWGYARSESFGVREDLLTPFIAKRLSEKLEAAGHEVFTTRPFPGTEFGDEIGESGEPRWKEAALFWLRACWAGHPLYIEKGKSLRGKAINSRPLFANQIKADLAVSLHVNASDSNHRAHGTSVWHRYNDPPSRELAQVVYDELVKDSRYDGGRGIKGDGYGWERSHAQKLAWFKRMNEDIPAILVEFLFFTNRGDASLLADEGHLERSGEAISEGIESYLREGSQDQT